MPSPLQRRETVSIGRSTRSHLRDDAVRDYTTRTRDVRDGLSSTLAMSERRFGDQDRWHDIGNVAVVRRMFDVEDMGGKSSPTREELQEYWELCWTTAHQYNGRRYNDSRSGQPSVELVGEMDGGPRRDLPG